MENKNRIIEIEAPVLEASPFIGADGSAAFYRTLCEATGHDYDKISGIDPSHIYVAPSLIDRWFEQWTKAGNDELSLTQQIVILGPKSDETLSHTQIKLEAGWVLD